MKKSYNEYHILTGIAVILFMLILSFTTSNPPLLLGIFISSLFMLITGEGIARLKTSIIFAAPFFTVIFLINIFFAPEGQTALFSIPGKTFTLEALVSSAILSFKILLVIFIFMLFDVLVDSDRAAAYFSAKMPKSTLMVMIGLKLLPNMRQRFKSLKEIYSVRGLNFEGKSIKEKIKSYVPVLSVLLESSLDGAFDIGEAVYVKGFLSGSRSIYDRQHFKLKDCIVLVFVAVLSFMFIIFKLNHSDAFDAYAGTYVLVFNKNIFLMFSAIIFFCIIFFCMAGETQDEIHRHQ